MAWLAAVPVVRLLRVAAVLGGTSTILVHALGLGCADMVFGLQLVWAALVWGLTLGWTLDSACSASRSRASAWPSP